MRVMGLVVVVPFMIVWTVLSIKTGVLIIPDTKLVMLVASAFAGKSAQSLFENFTGIHLSLPGSAGVPPASLLQTTNQNSERSQTAATTQPNV